MKYLGKISDPKDLVTNEWVKTTSGEKSKVLTGTLTSAGWSGTPASQTITVTGLVTSGVAYIVNPASASYEAYSTAQIYADDITIADSITFHCKTVPTTDIDVKIMKVEVQ